MVARLFHVHMVMMVVMDMRHMVMMVHDGVLEDLDTTLIWLCLRWVLSFDGSIDIVGP